MTIVRSRKTKATEAPAKMTAAVKRQVIMAFTLQRQNAALAKKNKQEADVQRDVLMPLIAEYGVPFGDDGQHRAIVLDEPIDGKTNIVRQRKVSRFLDLDKAEALAKRKGLLDKVQSITVTIADIPAEKAEALDAALAAAGLEIFGDVVQQRTFSQDRFYAAHQADRTKITEKDIDRIMVEEESFALAPTA